MSIEHPPHDKQSARRDTFRNAEHAGNVVPLREGNDVRQATEAPHQGDELLTALSPLLDEVDGLRGDETLHQDTNNVVLLLEASKACGQAVKSAWRSSRAGHVRSGLPR